MFNGRVESIPKYFIKVDDSAIGKSCCKWLPCSNAIPIIFEWSRHLFGAEWHWMKTDRMKRVFFAMAPISNMATDPRAAKSRKNKPQTKNAIARVYPVIIHTDCYSTPRCFVHTMIELTLKDANRQCYLYLKNISLTWTSSNPTRGSLKVVSARERKKSVKNSSALCYRSNFKPHSVLLDKTFKMDWKVNKI